MSNIDVWMSTALNNAQMRRFITDCKNGRAAHTYIVEGEEGSLREQMVRLAAMTLNCTHEGERPCLKCRSCRTAMTDTQEDIHVYTPKKKNIPVEDMRALISEMTRCANAYAYKIAIIEQAELMNDSSQNCLLKTLEEPIGASVFFLVTDNAESLLPTIRSRARLLRCPRVERDELMSALKRIYPSEEEMSLAEAVAFADGLPLLAERLLTDNAYRADVEEAKRFLLMLDYTSPGSPAEVFTYMTERKDKLAQLIDLSITLTGKHMEELIRTDADGKRAFRIMERLRALLTVQEGLASYANLNLLLDEFIIRTIKNS